MADGITDSINTGLSKLPGVGDGRGGLWLQSLGHLELDGLSQFKGVAGLPLQNVC